MSGSSAAAEALVMVESSGKSDQAFRTIGELAAELGLPQHILRYWETRFPQLRPLQRAGNRRYYRPADVELAHRIHRLLNQDGYTIKGVQQLLAKGRVDDDEMPAQSGPAPTIPQKPFPRDALKALRRKLVEALESTDV